MNSPIRKEEIMANPDQYRAVLDDLIRQRNEHLFRITEIDSAIAALRRLMPNEPVKVAMEQPTLSGLPGKYAGMGVRASVLRLLAEDAVAPMRTVEMANAFRIGGLSSTGKNFRGNVAAVISEMSRKRGEVVAATGGGWAITEKGRAEWIKLKSAQSQNSSSIFS
jgi:hypothetical protein